jgi:carbon-monoxide dehydrogenase medium subunit
VDSVDAAIALLAEYGDEASVLAGGQSLIPMLNMRLARPAVLVDIGRVEALTEIEVNGAVRLGSMVRQAAVERSPELAAKLPLLAQALKLVAHPGIRSRGTIGGSAAHADPASEIPAVLVALDARITVQGPAGERTIPASEFFVSTFMTSREPEELVTAVEVPTASATSRCAFLEVARRHGDYALVGVAVTSDFDAEGRLVSPRIVVTNVADVPFVATRAQDGLDGQQLDDDSIASAAALAAEDMNPVSDVHATAEYRRDIGETLVRRALQTLSRS